MFHPPIPITSHTNQPPQTVPDEQGGFTPRLTKEALEIGQSLGSKATTIQEVAKCPAVSERFLRVAALLCCAVLVCVL